MASAIHNLSSVDFDKLPDGSDYKIGVVVSEYHFDITEKLLEGCLDTLKKAGLSDENIKVISAPGTFELTYVTQRLNRWYECDALIAIGCVIKGDTDHDKYINHAVAQGFQNLSIKYGKPFIFGVLTPNTHQQALDRAGGRHGNKGVEVAAAALKSIAIERMLQANEKS